LKELAAAHAAAGRDELAEATYREALAKLPESHRNLTRLHLTTGLGRLLASAGRLDEARPYLAEAMEHARDQLPADQPQRHDAELAWAAVLARDGDERGARTLAGEVLERLEGRSDLHTERLRREAAGYIRSP
jgi:tetratricopeptide (TPR) repeat protein